MSQDPGSGNGETAQRLPQHPLVARLKPNPAQPAEQVTELAGLPGDSDRAGHQRLYLTARLDYYAEFLAEDVLYSETVPADQAPLPGLEASRVGIRRDATISYTWVRSPRPVDEWDLDVRLGAAGAAGSATPELVWSEWAYCTRTPDCLHTATCNCPHTGACPTVACAAAPAVFTGHLSCACKPASEFCTPVCTRGNYLSCAIGNCGGPI